jgi:hypothetical protein
MKRQQGVLFSIALQGGAVRFKLFKFIPWASVYFKDVEYFRISNKSEYYDCVRQGDNALFWPQLILGHSRRRAPIYVIKSAKDDRKFFFRARSGYHYMLRTEIGKAKSDQKTTPSPW